ncbi:hypothetical protein FACS1894184_14240 [Clostridia bacterium]|nr:hypothetical protein FACS1894184_14240 [Clostridia bacterium]
MSWNFVPVTSKPDHTLAFNQEINGEKKPLAVRLRYNMFAEYWYMDIMDAVSRKLYASCVPLVIGEYPCADMLEQFSYKGIGKAIIAKITDLTKSDIPNIRNLGIEFTLVWGDDTKLEVSEFAMG